MWCVHESRDFGIDDVYIFILWLALDVKVKVKGVSLSEKMEKMYKRYSKLKAESTG